MKEVSLSILVPVYKVEKYIRSFFESIFQQGLSDDCYEIIVVNDGTPDRSMEVVADLLEQHNNITIINQKNQGLSVARNVALDKAVGEYVLFLDSDDLLVKGSLPIMLEKAIESKADLVVANFLNFTDEEIPEVLIKGTTQDKTVCIETLGRDLFMKGLTVWHRLHRREFLLANNIRFIPGIYVQDVPFSLECLYKAGKCLETDIPFILHRIWNGAVTQQFTSKYASNWIVAYCKAWILYKSMINLTPQQRWELECSMWLLFIKFINNVSFKIPSFSEKVRILHELADAVPNLKFSRERVQRLISFLFNSFPQLLLIAWMLKKNRIAS